MPSYDERTALIVVDVQNDFADPAGSLAVRGGDAIVVAAGSDAELLLLWKSRKHAFGAIGRLSPSYCTQDGVVPRTKLPHILREIRRIGEHYGLRIANVFHAGDGNIHPILLFDERDADQVKRVLAASHEILEECVRCGGSVTGEHGIGVEKIDFMPKLFTPDDLAMMLRLRQAFNPDNRLASGHRGWRSCSATPGSAPCGTAGPLAAVARRLPLRRVRPRPGLDRGAG